MKNDFEKKLLVINPEDIRSLDDLEIVLNSVLIDFEMKEKSKSETMDLLLDVMIHMMRVAKKTVPFEKS